MYNGRFADSKGMQDIRTYITPLLQLAPFIVEAVTTTETSIPGAKQGGVKKAIVMACFSHLPELFAGISAMIDGIVAAKKIKPAPVA